MGPAVASAAAAVISILPVGARQQMSDPQRPPALAPFLDAPAIVSTTIPDAVNGIGVPVADEWAISTRPLSALRSAAPGTVELEPGIWEIKLESFSLSVGAVAPIPEEGFLLAPLRGDGAAVIQRILDAASAAPDVSQEQVQSVLWAVLSRAREASWPEPLRALAQRWLTPAQITQLDAKSLGPLPIAREDLMQWVRPSVAWALDAESKIRQQLAAGATYERLTQTAVRPGVFESELGDRDILSGRWNHHPSGYFVRFIPETFQRTMLQIVDVPRGRAQITRDAAGRIVRVIYPGDITFDVTYDVQTPPLSFPGSQDARGVIFQKIRATRVATGDAAEATDLPGGWTLMGRPLGTGSLPDPASSEGATLGAYPGAAERMAEAVWLYRGITSLEDAYQEGRRTEHADLIDAEFLRIGAREAVRAAGGRVTPWAQAFLEDATPAFNVIHCVLAAAVCRSENATRGRAPRILAPTSMIALSGSQQTQRIGMSMRPVR